jgi:CubicO group peptidase (beta-lactamase class C family)
MTARSGLLTFVSTFALAALALASCSNANGPAETAPVAGTPDIGADTPLAFSANIPAVDAMLKSSIDQHKIAGVASVIYQNGKEVYATRLGMADIEAGRPVSEDTLFQVYSMSKPVTGVALMTLFEQGKFELDDPLSEYLPGFETMQVFEGFDDTGAPVLVPAERPLTVLDIMTHTAGFGYIARNPAPEDYIGKLYAANPPLSNDNTLEEMTSIVAGMPLYFQPGTEWQYSLSVDVQARLTEVLSGMRFHDYLQKVIFDPLGMDDTHRFLNSEQVARLAAAYTPDPEGGMTRVPDEQFNSYNAVSHPLEMGGSGLVMTLEDYSKFARMLLGGGEFDGVRILKPETIKLMATDHLNWPMESINSLGSKGEMGFGIDFAVRKALPSTATEPAGAPGEFFWDGYASTLFWVDPLNDLTAIMFIQRLPFGADIHRDFRNAVYEGSAFAPPLNQLPD